MKTYAKWFVTGAALALCVAVGAAQAAKSTAQAGDKSAPQAKAQTWTGKISDSMCGAKHTMGKDPTECTTACVKGGGEYVFVGDKDKVYKIGNQKFADLAKHAGHTVEVTGTMKGDTITVEKIVMPKAK